MNGSVRISGLRELQRDFRKISKDLSKELRKELVQAAKPVADRSQALALGQITNMLRSPRWAAMRIGVSAAKASVYVVPRARSRGGSGRGNLKGLLLAQAMDPALMEKQDEVIRGIGDMIDNLAGANGF